ncbi:cyclase family protein [Acuticoccus sp. I52.16.1]|uniref:cyclase family protein n=1 Tax=Acuticoccus sp. I52.16.1 TaxID=2928472 RepID=UPI001FCFD3EC|nr:cyclase family protein [Acuticoccus sp. I52.16.1]UOM37328.1 cyclase family protein [Acuticoccus sp. I52.16.1]
MRIVDISNALETGIPSDPPMMLPGIEYVAHEDSVGQMAAAFPGLTADDLPGGEGWAVERLTVSTHNGTHLDAPYHHHSTMNGGERAITIDEVPLEWCFAPAVKLDLRHYADGHVLTAAEMEAEFAALGHTLAPLEIVLVNTAAGARYGEADYLAAGCGIGREATLWLLDQGVRVTGTDAWSWDAPFVHTARRWEVTRDPSIIWEGHRASMTTGYCHMEKLANLETLPASGFKVACFPFKIKGASAGFTRAVAIFED